MEVPMNPVNWFEIPVADMKRAKKFYEDVFGFQLALNEMNSTQMAWFPMLEHAAGATGTLVKGEGHQPSPAGSLVYFSVEDIEGILRKVSQGGGKTLVPKISIDEYGFIAHFQDCEGNRIAIHSMK